MDLDALLRAAGVAIGLVFAGVIGLAGAWRHRRDLLALVGCAVAYLVCATPARPCCTSAWALPLLAGAIAFPFAFWRLARVVLEDDATVGPLAWAGLGVLMAGGLLAAPDYLMAPAGWRWAGAVLNKLAAFGFIGGALYAAWRSWDGDLVAPRRRLRWWLMGYLGAHGVAVMLGEIYLLGERPPAWLDLLNAAAIDATLLATLLYLVQPRPAAMETLFAPAPQPRARADAGDAPQVARLRELMEVQKIYREPSLTVAMLAHRAGMAEYALRRLINEQLGHRNFAAYVNEHRLAEVAQRLREPRWARRPILTLALEAGFGSIGPFNRAFRERYGVTPTAYRNGQAVPAAGDSLPAG